MAGSKAGGLFALLRLPFVKRYLRYWRLSCSRVAFGPAQTWFGYLGVHEESPWTEPRRNRSDGNPWGHHTDPPGRGAMQRGLTCACPEDRLIFNRAHIQLDPGRRMVARMRLAADPAIHSGIVQARRQFCVEQ